MAYVPVQPWMPPWTSADPSCKHVPTYACTHTKDEPIHPHLSPYDAMCPHTQL